MERSIYIIFAFLLTGIR